VTLNINQTTQFKRDIKKLRKQGKNLSELLEIIKLLADEQPLPTQYRDHNLTGNWQKYRECHIRPDWLLIYQIDGTELYLARSGSHSELL
jgi:mRNA interferase YafQ